MKKLALLILTIIMPIIGFSQEKSSPRQFFDNLKKHEGKAYEGTVTTAPREGFSDKRLVMHVRSCEKNRICIPFFVGEDRSRTWVLTLKNDRVLLKHDHRHADGSKDKVTMYGGWSTNTGTPNMQMFPSDQYTCDLIDNGFGVWWITIDDKSYTYNLQRIGSANVFTVTFDLTKEVDAPDAPWGWEE